VAGEEANESSCKAVALCVDVEVVERDARLEIAVVNIAVEVTNVKVVKPQTQRGAMVVMEARRGSRRGRVRCQGRRNQGHRGRRRKSTMQSR